MLLSGEAIDVAGAIVTADDFHLPTNGCIFEAIVAVANNGTKADPVTVADHLRQSDQFERVGGEARLTGLQGGTPSVGSASKYAAIVQGHALRRRLLAVGLEVVELGYDLSTDTGAAVDRADELLS